ncbi:MAG TPA: energy-dependent translational throttle protein EttA [Polyangiales bacterium]|nr:energy-dependent translational throttle protein EttA [Polyangiales bacterium]
MTDYIYTLQGASKVHPPDKKVLSNIYLSFLPGAKIGVLGANGAGKSSLLRIMAGVDKTFTGEAWARPGATVGFLSQEPDLGAGKTVVECVDEAVKPTRDLLNRFEALSMKLGEDLPEAEMNKVMEEHARIQDQIEACDAWSLDHQLELAMDALRLPPPEQEVQHLSGGERRRVALCQILLKRPDLLLLDEPTNHLDAESVAWLEQHLAQYPGCVVAVTHDRYFLDNVAEWILELDRGEGYPFKGNYSAWLDQKQTRLSQEEKAESARQRKLKHELEWVRASPRARQAKSQARLKAYDTMLNESTKAKRDPNEIHIPPGPRLGDLVIEAEGLRKAFGDKLLYDDLNFKLPKNGIVGVVGPNGAGKTTLFRMLVEQEKPDAGTLRIGDTVKIAYVDQSRDALKGDRQVWQEIADGKDTVMLGKQEVPARGYVSLFNFKGSDQQKLVKNLSGGERNRVHLAKLLKSGGNLLLLDEPTNDLDVETLRSLEDALLGFPGCAIVISHDRWFLDRIATHILAFEGDSAATWFEGSYQDYEADRKKRLGDEAERPHRIKYRKL